MAGTKHTRTTAPLAVIPKIKTAWPDNSFSRHYTPSTQTRGAHIVWHHLHTYKCPWHSNSTTVSRCSPTGLQPLLNLKYVYIYVYMLQTAWQNNWKGQCRKQGHCNFSCQKNIVQRLHIMRENRKGEVQCCSSVGKKLPALSAKEYAAWSHMVTAQHDGTTY